jgi:two-component system, OmpR family, response regulator CpxR
MVSKRRAPLFPAHCSGSTGPGNSEVDPNRATTTPLANRLLVVDDDAELCSLVARYLEAEGFEVDAVHGGEQGVERALSGKYSLVVLDVMLPGLNGFDVLRRISTTARVPVLMLSARGEDVDRIVGLQIGADDYLPKPFNPHELVARIRAILRRAYPEAQVRSNFPTAEGIAVGEIELDKNSWKVRRSGETVELTALEFNLLEVFLKAVGRVLTREELARTVLEREFGPFDRSIDMHVSNLRKKLGRQSDGSERIKSVRGVGYVYTRPSTLGHSPA